MTPVFADTSYFLALVNPVDPGHAAATILAENALGRTFVIEYVLIELGSQLSRGSDRTVFLDLLKDLRGDRSVSIIPASEGLFEAGLALFASRPDKNWSLVDCTSFIVMKQRRLRDALTTDQHFVQAGFRALLRETRPA